MLDERTLKSALRYSRIVWRQHALERMLQRGIGRKEVKKVISQNDQIETYPNDSPFPSALFFGTVGSRALHVSVALDQHGETVHVISVYEPDSLHFEDDLRTRRDKR